jgi:hypothetical protein
VKPADVTLNEMLLPLDSLGNIETEIAAGLVIIWHRAEGHVDWVPVTMRTVIDWLTYKVEGGDERLGKLVRNPFWNANPHRLRDEGWISGWTNPDDPGVFTEKALRCFAARGLWKTERGEAVRS